MQQRCVPHRRGCRLCRRRHRRRHPAAGPWRRPPLPIVLISPRPLPLPCTSAPPCRQLRRQAAAAQPVRAVVKTEGTTSGLEINGMRPTSPRVRGRAAVSNCPARCQGAAAVWSCGAAGRCKGTPGCALRWCAQLNQAEKIEPPSCPPACARAQAWEVISKELKKNGVTFISPAQVGAFCLLPGMAAGAAAAQQG